MSDNLQLGRGCVLKQHSSALNTEFGMNLFLKKAGADAPAILEQLGKYTRGKRKGTQKGFLVWLKVVEGGYDYQGGRGVLRGGSIEYRVTAHFGTSHENCEIHLENHKQRCKEIQDELDTIQQRIEKLEQSIKEDSATLDAGIPTDVLERLRANYPAMKDNYLEIVIWGGAINSDIEESKSDIEDLNKRSEALKEKLEYHKSKNTISTLKAD